MEGFCKRDSQWCADDVALIDVARAFSTPCYVYSQTALCRAYSQLQGVFCHSRPTICYAVKANDNLSLLQLLAGEGANFDIVSGGELSRVLAAGGRGADVVFSGVGKTRAEIDAALDAGVGCFNVESAAELSRIEQCARAKNTVAPVAFRLTLNIDGGTHRHLTTGLSEGKFGVSADEGRGLARRVAAESENKHLDFLGYSCHIGSQIADENTYVHLANAMAEQVRLTEQDGITVRRVDMGGGFAVDDEKFPPLSASPPKLAAYDAALAELFSGKELFIEPGRSIAACAGALLTTVEYVKQAGNKTIWITDAGMNDFLRPALYGTNPPSATVSDGGGEVQSGDIVGPVCESADIIARVQNLAASAGDVLVIFNVGAYGLCMASNYNARPRPAAVLLHNGKMRQIRRRETTEEMLAAER